MARLIISTRQGVTYEAEVRDFHDAEREMRYFERQYLSNHFNDSIVDASVIAGGSIISRFRGGSFEPF